MPRSRSIGWILNAPRGRTNSPTRIQHQSISQIASKGKAVGKEGKLEMGPEDMGAGVGSNVWPLRMNGADALPVRSDHR